MTSNAKTKYRLQKGKQNQYRSEVNVQAFKSEYGCNQQEITKNKTNAGSKFF